MACVSGEDRTLLGSFTTTTILTRNHVNALSLAKDFEVPSAVEVGIAFRTCRDVDLSG